MIDRLHVDLSEKPNVFRVYVKSLPTRIALLEARVAILEAKYLVDRIERDKQVRANAIASGLGAMVGTWLAKLDSTNKHKKRRNT